MSAAFDLDMVRRWIGREDHADDVVTASLVDRFRATLGMAADPARDGDAAPRSLHFCLCQPAVPMARLGIDGHPDRGGFLPPVPLPRRMWAASEMEFIGDIRVGDAVHRQSRVADVTAKTGRSGALCFVTVEHAFSVRGGCLVSERQTIVYRDSGGEAKMETSPVPAGVDVKTIDPSPALLFRYSALTFNAHRIHYDLPYATGDEGYAGLVVHGPLQASLLVDLAARQRGTPPDRFAFRGRSPAFGGRPLTLHAGAIEGDRVNLWSAQDDGPVTMEATARWC